MSRGYEPRQAFLPFHQRTQRWSCIVAHRRAGKTVACVMDLLTAALSTKKPNGRYAYIAPYREQAKTAAWSYVQQFAFPVVDDPENDLRQSDLIARLNNGSQVRLFGADNPNALRGAYFDGVVLDEYADMKPSLWTDVVRPALADRRGWAVFIGTPRGHDGFYDIWNAAQGDPEWFTLHLPASKSGILPPEELAAAKRAMSPASYEQEFELSWEAAIIGAIYAPMLQQHAPNQTRVPYRGGAVHAAWDIGVGDATAIWVWQNAGGAIEVLDYYEASGERISHYIEWLRGRGYSYDTMWLPHDANNRQLTGLTVAESVREAGFGVKVLPRASLEEGIEAVRKAIPRMYFDLSRCSAGLEALKNYRWEYNDRLGQIKTSPRHDWSSHGADAMRYLAMAQAQLGGRQGSGWASSSSGKDWGKAINAYNSAVKARV